MAGISDEKRAEEQKTTLEDIDAAAKARGTTRAKVLQDIADGTQSAQDITHAGQRTTKQDGLNQEYDSDQLQSNPVGRQDGYSETQGGYEQYNSAGQPAHDIESQDAYDPTHSGVRHAQNRPGTRPPTPGRETGTAWGQDQQMGATTDTPDRKNPAD